MAEQAHDNKNWSARDFERYHAGDMPAQERHSLEKAALEDPFLADALEGYIHTQTAVKDIEEIRARMSGEQKSRKLAWFTSGRPAIRLFKIAAVMFLFLGLAWLLRVNMTPDKQTEIAKVKPVLSASDSTTENFTKILRDTAQPTVRVAKLKDAKQEVRSSASKAMPPPASTTEDKSLDLVVVARQKDYTDTAAAGSALAAAKTESQPIEKIDLFSREKAAAPPASINKAIEGKVSGVVIRNQNTIRGRVVDNAGNPVAFANINDRQNNTILSADQDGYFALNNRQNASKIKVDVNAVGFETNNIALNANAAENKVVLKESNQALSEVVVGYQKKRSQDIAMKPAAKEDIGKSSEKLSFTNVVPVAGWSHFNQYVKDSLSSNPVFFNNALKDTTVRIFFDIGPAGTPVNIQFQNVPGDSAKVAASKLLEVLPALKKIDHEKPAMIIIRF